MRCPSVLVLLTLGVAAAAPAHAGKDPFAFFADGASAVEIEGSGKVPLLRGADTSGRPAVLAQGKEKDEPDEFLMTMRMAVGPNACTEPVVKALGGTIEEFTLGRKGQGAFKSSIKLTTKGASIPELRLKGPDGTIVIRDWHCEVNPTDNALSVLSLSEAAVAMLADEGTVAFVSADQGEALLKQVGEPIQGVRNVGSFVFDEGRLYGEVGAALVLPGKVLGQDGNVMVQTNRSSRVSEPLLDLPFKSLRGPSFYTAGSFEIGGVQLTDGTTFLVSDRPVERAIAENPADDIAVAGSIGFDDLIDVSIAVDPSTNRIAVAKVEKASWTDSGTKMIEDAKKQFDKKDKSASLLAPLAPETAVAMSEGPVCSGEPTLREASFQSRDGVRYFGVAAVGIEPSTCVEPKADRVISRLDNGAAPQTVEADSEAEGGGTSDGADPKEAQRLADYADVLWKNGRYAEAIDLYDRAKDLAPEDCSYFHDFSWKAMLLGRTDDAYEAAKHSAELYEPWAAQSLEIRLDVQQGREVPEGTITKAQSHDCYSARGLQANAALARGAHKEVEQLYADHMDLDQSLAGALALSRLQRGQSSRARGPALQALDVGARGTAIGHSIHGAVVSRGGSERLLDANLERLHSLPGLNVETVLTGVAMARTRSEDKVKTFLDRVVTERPGVASGWIVYGLEAKRRGDQAAMSKVQAKADALARDTFERGFGSVDARCDAAALLYVAGKTAEADAMVEGVQGMPEGVSPCPTTDAIAAAYRGDAQGTTNALQDLSRRMPPVPVGTLGLLRPLPAPKAE